MNFADILCYLTDGIRVKREDWDYWITIIQNPSSNKLQIVEQKDDKDIIDETALWKVSQEDILAVDWIYDEDMDED